MVGRISAVDTRHKEIRPQPQSESVGLCLQRSDEGREGVKFKGAVCTGIDSLSGDPPSLQIDLKIVDNHTDGSALRHIRHGAAHTHVKAPKLGGRWRFYFSPF